ncbi:hypothetical protein PROFUN_02799 [Planoprotostelium fungivorum]|uniref:Uncharacterized protein n=1 Tax=Planoprotostelium fungivorum TaxID=1890364 RepID=A0A2P6NXL4_9EUKA|nr:hypothetical protein PROFUN_02799 [Planoprotostelium fungivorum]
MECGVSREAMVCASFFAESFRRIVWRLIIPAGGDLLLILSVRIKPPEYPPEETAPIQFPQRVSNVRGLALLVTKLNEQQHADTRLTLTFSQRGNRDRIVLVTKFLHPDVTLKSLELHGPSHLLASGRNYLLSVTLSTRRVLCNLSVDQTEYVWKYLKERDIPMVSSQIEFALITVIAYSPLVVGRHIMWTKIDPIIK